MHTAVPFSLAGTALASVSGHDWCGRSLSQALTCPSDTCSIETRTHTPYLTHLHMLPEHVSLHPPPPPHTHTPSTHTNAHNMRMRTRPSTHTQHTHIFAHMCAQLPISKWLAAEAEAAEQKQRAEEMAVAAALAAAEAEAAKIFSDTEDEEVRLFFHSK